MPTTSGTQEQSIKITPSAKATALTLRMTTLATAASSASRTARAIAFIAAPHLLAAAVATSRRRAPETARRRPGAGKAGLAPGCHRPGTGSLRPATGLPDWRYPAAAVAGKDPVQSAKHARPRAGVALAVSSH